MITMILCNDFDDIITSIGTNLNCYFLYETNAKRTYKVTYDFNNKNLREYFYMEGLNGGFGLFKNVDNLEPKAAISLLRHWYNNNKNKIKILTKSVSLLFMQNIKLNESNSCWKTPKGLKKAIENGLEVPNCIPDSEYKLEESQIFIDRKNRELISRYKKAKEWLDTMIANGDKQFAEKMMIIVDKWRRAYEDRIKTAKSYLKEEYHNLVFTLADLDDYFNRCERSYAYYEKSIKRDFDEKYQQMYMDKLNHWYSTTKTYLEKKREELAKTPNEPVEIHYQSFGFIDESAAIPDITSFLMENRTQEKIQQFIEDHNKLKSALANFKEENGFDKLSPEEKKALLDKFYTDFINK